MKPLRLLSFLRPKIVIIAGQQRRWLNQSQVSTALRPFFFLVHPDLFFKFPTEQAINDSSLKSLQFYLTVKSENGDGGGGGRSRLLLDPVVDVTFYLKPGKSPEKPGVGSDGNAAALHGRLRSVRLCLRSDQTVRSAILSVLKSCNLPTSYVDSLPEDGHVQTRTSGDHRRAGDYPADDDPVDEAEARRFRKSGLSTAASATDIAQPLQDWLALNVEGARARLAKTTPVRLELERRQDELCQSMGIEAILWDSVSGWETAHRHGTLASFRQLCLDHRDEVRELLAGKKVVFGGRGGGVSLEGHLVLYSGEVRHNWLNVIRQVPEGYKVLRQVIPPLERSLSGLLRDVRVVRTKHQPITLVDDYRQRLVDLITKVGDYLSRNNRFPEQWPPSLSHLEVCVETGACTLMVTPAGQIIVPSGCPGFLLVKFLSENMEEAARTLAAAAVAQQEADALVARCLNELGLIQMDVDESLDSAKATVSCCRRLLEEAPNIRHLTHGNHLVITRYYSVLADGIICVPWNWRARREAMD